MKSTGIVRKVDELGRIVLPIELRRTLDIAVKDAIEIYVDGESIILKKYEPTCIFCGDGRNVENYRGNNNFANCMNVLRSCKKENQIIPAVCKTAGFFVIPGRFPLRGRQRRNRGQSS